MNNEPNVILNFAFGGHGVYATSMLKRVRDLTELKVITVFDAVLINEGPVFIKLKDMSDSMKVVDILESLFGEEVNYSYSFTLYTPDETFCVEFANIEKSSPIHVKGVSSILDSLEVLQNLIVGNIPFNITLKAVTTPTDVDTLIILRNVKPVFADGYASLPDDIMVTKEFPAPYYMISGSLIDFEVADDNATSGEMMEIDAEFRNCTTKYCNKYIESLNPLLDEYIGVLIMSNHQFNAMVNELRLLLGKYNGMCDLGYATLDYSPLQLLPSLPNN